MTEPLYHLSEEPGITRFEPRPRPAGAPAGEPAVWAIDRAHLRNYLLPRDCPRVTFHAKPGSDPADVDRLLAGARSVVAIESGWVPRLLETRLYRYALPPGSFTRADAGAGYWVSRTAVAPLAVTAIPDLLAALLEEDVELRITPSLWPLYDRVVESTLQFSIIRMRNARPRPGGSPCA
jgi:hypothetical protein